MGLSFLGENAISGQTYLEMLQQWLFPQFNKDFENFILSQDGEPLDRRRKFEVS